MYLLVLLLLKTATVIGNEAITKVNKSQKKGSNQNLTKNKSDTFRGTCLQGNSVR